MTIEPSSPPDDDRPLPAGPRPVISSRELFAGRREVIIQHGQEQYRLRLTSSNKLLLIK